MSDLQTLQDIFQRQSGKSWVVQWNWPKQPEQLQPLNQSLSLNESPQQQLVSPEELKLERLKNKQSQSSKSQELVDKFEDHPYIKNSGGLSEFLMTELVKPLINWEYIEDPKGCKVKLDYIKTVAEMTGYKNDVQNINMIIPVPMLSKEQHLQR